MLVLSRKKDEKILLQIPGGEVIEVTVVRIDANKVRIGIDASEDVKIVRSELNQSQKSSESKSVCYQ